VTPEEKVARVGAALDALQLEREKGLPVREPRILLSLTDAEYGLLRAAAFADDTQIEIFLRRACVDRAHRQLRILRGFLVGAPFDVR
jgi:hypothetical protein